MKIIAHRGYWRDCEEKNTVTACQRAFNESYGVETDIRDHDGQLVISHDLPSGNKTTFDQFLQVYVGQGSQEPLALNVKADGLQILLKEALVKYGVSHYFFFDMSIPDALQYVKESLNIFVRQSEYEQLPLSLYEEAKGVWLDCFINDWIDEETIAQHLLFGKQVCVVSPELHKRPNMAVWEKYKKMSVLSDGRLMLCTDYPSQAKEFFGE